jgi:phosphoglycerol transferase
LFSISGPGSKFVSLELWKNAAGYIAAVVVSVAVVALALDLRHARWNVPLYATGDNLTAQMFVQNVLESGWVLDNARLGAPGAMDLRDYPIPDVLHAAMIKLLGCVSWDSAVVLNLYYLLAFPLTAVSAYFVFRRFRLGRLAALVPGVLYACMPYHFLRVYGHLFLAGYYMLPLMSWVILRVYLGRNPLLQIDQVDGRLRWRFATWEAVGAVLVCVLVGLGGIYYAFFSGYLLLAAGIKAAFRERRLLPLGGTAVLILILTAAGVAALWPSLVQLARYGNNPEAAVRSPVEADTFALNASEMLLPVGGHRVSFLADLTRRFLSPPRRPTGSALATALGSLGSLGFLFLLGRFLWRRPNRSERLADGLGYLTLVAMMLGTIGGIGSCFAFYVSPMIRCYDRMSIYIAFFALAGLFLFIHHLANRHAQGRWSGTVYAVAMVVLLGLGALDQTSPFFVPAYAEIKAQAASDADFGHRLEATLPPGSLVFQLPYVPFPESPPVHKLTDYELLRPFLHTRTLHFSYGAMKGRDASRWQANVAASPLPEAVKQLAFAGFSGIYLDRDGFTDRGAATEAELTHLLDVVPLVSWNGRQSFFDMTAYVQSLRCRFTDEAWQAKREEALHPVALSWGGSFSGLEPAPTGNGWRWCGARGELRLVNPLDRPSRVVLTMTCLGWAAAPARLIVDGDLIHRELQVSANPAGAPLEMDLTVPPGEHVLSFVCDGPRMPAPGDPREIVFRIDDFQLRVPD